MTQTQTLEESQITQRLIRIDRGVQGELLDLIKRYNDRVEDSKKVKLKEIGGQYYIVNDDNFIEFLRATDLRENYELRLERTGWVISKKDENKRRIDGGFETELGATGSGLGLGISYEDRNLGKIGAQLGLGEHRFYFNQFSIGWFQRAQAPLVASLGLLSFSSEGLGLNIPRFGSWLDFIIALSINPLLEALNKDSIEEGVLHFIGVTEEVREKFEKDGIIGAIVAWFGEIGRRVIGIWDNVLESLDQLRYMISGKPRDWELGVMGSILMFLRAVNSIRKNNFHEAEHIMQGILNSKDAPLWIRGLVMNLEHSYWRDRTKPFSSLFTALDFLFHGNRDHELNKRLEEVERKIETEDFNKLDDKQKMQYMINLFYLLSSQRDFNPSKMIENLPAILEYLVERGDISSLVFLAHALRASPFRFKNQEWNNIDDKITKMLLSSYNIGSNLQSPTVAANNVNKFIAAMLFRAIQDPNSTDLLFSSMFATLSRSDQETKEQASATINKILDSLRDISVYDPRLGLLLYLPLLSSSKEFGFFNGSIRDHLSKIPRSYNPEFGLSEISGRNSKIIFPNLISMYERDGRKRLERLINNLREYGERPSEELREAITQDVEYLMNNPWIMELYRYLDKPDTEADQRGYLDTLTVLSILAGGRLDGLSSQIQDERLREGLNKYIDNIATEKTTTPLKSQSDQNTDQQPRDTEKNSSSQNRTSKILSSIDNTSTLPAIFRKSRKVATGSQTKPNDPEFLSLYEYVQKNYDQQNELESFKKIFGEKHGEIIYEQYRLTKRLFPNLDPILYIAMILYELNRIYQNNNKAL